MLALAGLSVFALLLALAVTALVASAIVAHVASFPEAGPWPVDFRPTLGELGVMTTGAYWAEEYMPTLEEVSAIISPLSEFTSIGGPIRLGDLPAGMSPLYGFTPPGGSVECGGCHLPLEAQYPSGDPAACFHAYAEQHPDECDCIDCHLPPHPVVSGECKCCDCHGCWDTGWAVKEEVHHLETSECFVCHGRR